MSQNEIDRKRGIKTSVKQISRRRKKRDWQKILENVRKRIHSPLESPKQDSTNQKCFN